MEIIASILGIIQGILVMLNKRSNWIFYILQMIFLIIFSCINHLYGDVLNNSIYLILGFIGFLAWSKKKETNNISSVNNIERMAYISLIIIGTLVLNQILKTTNDPLPLLDSFTTISSLVATYYMIKKKIDTWVIWFINDIFYAIEYFMLPNQALYLFLLNIVWAFMAIGSYINWNRIMKENNNMIKMFYSGTYKVRHEKINEENVLEMLKDDIRSKIVGNVKDTVYASNGVPLKNNKNVMYVGGFYYEKQNKNKSVCENVVSEELKQIDRCDLVVANLTKYSAIASVTEIIYAAFKQKKIVIFCDPKVTSNKIEGEYWFPILTSKQLNKNIEVKFVNNEDEIINYVNQLREE
ncbi:MAG: nicotinamide mononucleotide transporter [Bacilli bacterium]|nr:nicotinamide mononucleotide transporter [Bacilli bacterium]